MPDSSSQNTERTQGSIWACYRCVSVASQNEKTPYSKALTEENVALRVALRGALRVAVRVALRVALSYLGIALVRFRYVCRWFVGGQRRVFAEILPIPWRGSHTLQ